MEQNGHVRRDGDQAPGEVREELMETGGEGTGFGIDFLCSNWL